MMAAQTTTPIVRDPAHLDEALPWYRNGTLSAEDRAWVEAQLAERDAEGSRAAAFDDAIETALGAEHDALPADLGWPQLLARARAEAPAARARSGANDAQAGVAGRAAGTAGATGRGRAAGQGALARVADWFGSLLSPQLGMAMAALLVVQAVAIGWLATGGQGGGDTVEYRSAPGAAPVATIRALLVASTTEQALREGLLANGAVIIDGPNDLGEYWILAPGRSAEAVAGALRDAGIIASFVIDHRPRVR